MRGRLSAGYHDQACNRSGYFNGDEVMSRRNAPPYRGDLFLSMGLLVSVASTPSLHAQAQPYYTLCRYQGQEDGHPIIYVTPIIHTSAGASDISQNFNKYMTVTYDLSMVQSGGGYCQPVSASADQQAYTMSQLKAQWAASKTVVTQVDWTDTPAEVAAINSKLAASAAAAAVPTAPADQHYVFCNSGRVEVAGGVEYFSDVFPAVTLPQQPASGGKMGNGGDYRNAVAAFQRPFLAFLQKRYGFKDSGNYPTECAIRYPPTAGGLQQAQAAKKQLRDLALQHKAQIIETGWKNQ
jgi:hypothetical protein